MIFVFVVDTSASMNQRTPNGMSYLDCAKSAIEHFVEVRQRDHNAARTDRYLLVTCEEGDAAYKVGITDRPQTFLDELKNLRALDVSDLGTALKKSLVLLNQSRLKNGYDTFGLGRQPWNAEPAIILVLTDGGTLSNTKEIIPVLTLPSSPSFVGEEFCREPFRWEQRIFGFLMRFSNQQVQPATKHPSLTPLCDATGGKCTVYTNMKQLLGGMDSLLQKLQMIPGSIGLVVNFEPIQTADAQAINAPSAHRKQIFVKLQQPGAWPLPEDFIVSPDKTPSSLPQRSAHPTIKFNPTPTIIPNHPTDFSVDRYPIEPCALTEWLLSSNNASSGGQSNNSSTDSTEDHSGVAAKNKNLLCYECCIVPSNADQLSTLSFAPTFMGALPYPPFGFLKPHFELLHSWHMNLSSKWKLEFDRYINTLPPMYLSYLRTALKRWTPPPVPAGHPVMSAQVLLPENLVSGTQPLPPAVMRLLRELKQRSKEESERLEAVIAAQRLARAKKAMNKINKIDNSSLEASRIMDIYSVDPANLEAYMEQLRNRIFSKLQISQQTAKHLKAPVDPKHSVPIREMGNYQEFLQKQKTLRPLESSPDMKPYFGNPFVKLKNSKIAGFADEVDTGLLAGDLTSPPPSPARGVKRKSASPSLAARLADSKKKQVKLNSGEAAPTASSEGSVITKGKQTPANATVPAKKPPLPPTSGAKKAMARPHIQQQSTTTERTGPTPLTYAEKLAQVRHNTSIKVAIIGILRQPHKVDTLIMEKLNEVIGDATTKRQFVEEILQLAALYRKKIDITL